jgi:hypothetical protein
VTLDVRAQGPLVCVGVVVYSAGEQAQMHDRSSGLVDQLDYFCDRRHGRRADDGDGTRRDDARIARLVQERPDKTGFVLVI